MLPATSAQRKKPTYWQAHHPLWPNHWACRFSRLHWIVSEMEFSFSLSTLKLQKKQQRRKNQYFLLWTYFLARKCSKGTHVRYRSKKLGINRLRVAHTWVRLLTLLLNSFLSSCFCGVLNLFLHLVLIGPETGQSGCFLVWIHFPKCRAISAPLLYFVSLLGVWVSRY